MTTVHTSRLLLLIALLATAGLSNAQRQVVFPAKMNVLYVGVDNPLDILLEGCPCEDVVVVPEDGTATPSGDCGQYTYRVDKPGQTLFCLTCSKGKNRDTVCSGYYRIKYPPLPFAWIDNKSGGRIGAKRLHESIGVGWTLRDFDFEMYYRIVGYEITLIRGKDGKGTTLSNDRDVFTKDIADMLSSAVAGDVLMVRNIQVVTRGGDRSNIAPIVFEVE